MTERPAAGHGLNKFTAPFAKRPKVESGQSTWFKYIKIVHLVFCESFNGRHGRYSDRFLQEKRGDWSLALLNILKIFHSQFVTKWRHRYLPKTYLWLSAVLLEMSLSQKSRKLALKPCRTSLSSEKLTMKEFCSTSASLVKLPTLANQNWRKNWQERLANKKSLYIFLKKSDVTEHD